MSCSPRLQWRKEHRNDPSAPEVAVPYTPPPPPMLAKASAPAPKTVGKAADADGCTIKGNINSNKDRIYHMPGAWVRGWGLRVSLTEEAEATQPQHTRCC